LPSDYQDQSQKQHRDRIMQTIRVGQFKARFSEMNASVRAGETIVVAYGNIFKNEGTHVLDRSCGSASREFPGASFKLSANRPACNLRLPVSSAHWNPIAVNPDSSRAANSAISSTSGLRSLK